MLNLIFLIFLPIIVMQSCVTSLQPLVTEKTILTDTRILGTWTSNDQNYTITKVLQSEIYDQFKNRKSLETFSFTDFDQDSILYSKSYVIRYRKNNLNYDLLGSMIKLDGNLYINFSAVSLNDIHNSSDFTTKVPSYTIARLQFTNTNAVKLDFINDEFLRKQINARNMKVKYQADELYDTFLITASTDDLQHFIVKYGKDERFFNKERSITLVRKY